MSTPEFRKSCKKCGRPCRSGRRWCWRCRPGVLRAQKRLWWRRWRRAGRVTSLAVYPRAVLCVARAEASAYRRAHPRAELLVMPNAAQGHGMSICRNWILDHAPTADVVMADDDCTVFARYEHGERRKPTPAETERFIEQGFRMAAELGTVLWGVNQQFDPMFYREYSPLSLLSPILGPFMGIRKTDLRFDLRLPLKEDYDFSLQVLNRHRKVLRFNAWHYVVGHLEVKGGCASSRTMAAEREQMAVFKRKWGPVVAETRRGRESVNPLVKWPVPGI